MYFFQFGYKQEFILISLIFLISYTCLENTHNTPSSPSFSCSSSTISTSILHPVNNKHSAPRLSSVANKKNALQISWSVNFPQETFPSDILLSRSYRLQAALFHHLHPLQVILQEARTCLLNHHSCSSSDATPWPLVKILHICCCCFWRFLLLCAKHHQKVGG